MTLYLLRAAAWPRCRSLPRRLMLSEINADHRRYLGELEQGGAILVVSDDEQAFLGVLTRDPAVLGDAQLAQLIETGAVPPLERLLHAPTDAPAAWRARRRSGGGRLYGTLARDGVVDVRDSGDAGELVDVLAGGSGERRSLKRSQRSRPR